MERRAARHTRDPRQHGRHRLGGIPDGSPGGGGAMTNSIHRMGGVHGFAPGLRRFKVGDRGRTRTITPTTHTRLPRYARGKLGRVETVRGCHVFPDSAALGAGETPQWLYTVVFAGRELWGEEADPSIKVSIEAFEPYLLPSVHQPTAPLPAIPP